MLPSLSSRATRTFGLSLLVLLIFALWLASLTQRSVWADELGTTEIIKETSLAEVLRVTPILERRPPFYFVALWLWTNAAGKYEFALRYFSLLCAMLAVAAAAALARQLIRRFTVPHPNGLTLAATTLFAFAPTVALYVVMVRYYALVLCLALLLSVVYLRWVEAAQPSLRVRVCWLLIAFALVYADYSALALIGAQTVDMIWRQRAQWGHLHQWTAAMLVLAVAYIPLLVGLLDQVGRDKVDADLSRSTIGLVLRAAYPFFSFTFGETILPWHIAVLLAAPFVVLAFVAAIRNAQTRLLFAYLALMLGLPLAFNVFILTAIATDLTFLTVASRTLFALPFLVMGLAAGIVALPTRWRAVTVVLLGGANIIALINLFIGAQYHNPIYAVPLRAVSESLRADEKADDIIISDLDIALQYYWQQPPRPAAQLYLTDDDSRARAHVVIENARAPQVFLLTYGRDRSRTNDHTDEFLQSLASHYTLLAEREYVPIDPVYRVVKDWLFQRETYRAKLTVRVFEQKP